MQALLVELRKISKQLEPEDSYFDRDQLSLGSVVALPTETLISKALQEYTQYVITTDGDIATITYQVKAKTGASFGPEVEAKDLAYIPGPVQSIRFGNDTAQSGKNINLIKYHTSRLAPPMVPPSPPGTRSELADPFLSAGGPNAKGMMLAFIKAKFTGVGDIIVFTAGGIATTNQFDTLESPLGTNYQVTVGKRLIIFFGIFRTSAVAKGIGIGYADDGVSNSATGGTNTVTRWVGGAWKASAADSTEELEGMWAEIPSSKFPQAESESNSGTILHNWLGVEVDN